MSCCRSAWISVLEALLPSRRPEMTHGLPPIVHQTLPEQSSNSYKVHRRGVSYPCGRSSAAPVDSICADDRRDALVAFGSELDSQSVATGQMGSNEPPEVLDTKCPSFVGSLQDDSSFVGLVTLADGTTCRGRFENGMLVAGVMIVPDGTVIEQREDGDFVSASWMDIEKERVLVHTFYSGEKALKSEIYYPDGTVLVNERAQSDQPHGLTPSH